MKTLLSKYISLREAIAYGQLRNNLVRLASLGVGLKARAQIGQARVGDLADHAGIELLDAVVHHLFVNLQKLTLLH